MARIPMKDGFTIIPEGTYVFRIYDAQYDADFGKILVHLVNADGMTHTERFSILNKDGSYNDGALGAFSYFAKTAMNNFTMEDVDCDELIGHYISAEVVHNKVQSIKDPSKTNTFANLGDKAPASGFDKQATEKAMTMGRKSENTATAPQSPSNLDVASLLD